MTSQTLRPTLRAWYILFVLVMVTFAAGLNRQILFLVVEPLKAEMLVSDSQIGILIGIAPGILAGAGALLLGWLTDRTSRHYLLAACVVFWSSATALLSVATNYSVFFTGVMFLALGETALGPICSSITPDIFPGKSRVTANLIFAAAGSASAGLGTAASGALLGWVQNHIADVPTIIQSLSYWRVAFLVIAIAGVPMALLSASIGQVARTSIHSNSTAGLETLKSYFRAHWKTALGLYVAIGLFSFAGNAVMSWTPTYIIRMYQVSAAEVGFSIGLSAALGGMAGIAAAFLVFRKVSEAFGTSAPRQMFIASMVALLIPTLLHLTASTATFVFVLVGVQIFLASFGSALITTMIQDISPAKLRGQLFGVSALVITVISSLSPFAVGLISDQLPNGPKSLLWAITLVVVPSVIAAALSLWKTTSAFKGTNAILAI